MCWDGLRLYLLEASGARVLVLSDALVPDDTVPLGGRSMTTRGMAVDRYYLYLWDDNALYRTQKDQQSLSPWVNNVRVAGLVTYGLGEVLISDADRGAIWLKMFFGDSRAFFPPGGISHPTALAELPQGRFAVLSRADRVIVFNRAGIVVATYHLSQVCDLMCADPVGTLYLGRKGGSVLTVLDGRSERRFDLDGVKGMTALVAFSPGRLAVLDNASRLVAYEIGTQ